MASGGPRIDLTNQFLIAMPGMADDTFSGTVVYLCEHTEKGALGLVINKPIDIKLKNLFEKVDLSLDREELAEQPVYFGGPVQTERGFVLHEKLGQRSRRLQLDAVGPGGLEMTTSKDVLEALATAPARAACWSRWATAAGGRPAGRRTGPQWLAHGGRRPGDHLRHAGRAERYDRAVSLLGFDPRMLSQEAGHA
jgi:putative transcriptional regulator